MLCTQNQQGSWYYYGVCPADTMTRMLQLLLNCIRTAYLDAARIAWGWAAMLICKYEYLAATSTNYPIGYARNTQRNYSMIKNYKFSPFHDNNNKCKYALIRLCRIQDAAIKFIFRVQWIHTHTIYRHLNSFNMATPVKLPNLHVAERIRPFTRFCAHHHVVAGIRDAQRGRSLRHQCKKLTFRLGSAIHANSKRDCRR